MLAIGGLIAFVVLMLALVKGCAAMEKSK